MDNTKFYLKADELRENRLRAVCRTIEDIIIRRNLNGDKHVWVREDTFSDFSHELFEKMLVENGFLVSYRTEKVCFTDEKIMVIEWD